MAEVNRQWRTRQDGLEKIFQTSCSVPVPGDGEVLVRIKAVSLNYRDTEVAMGLYNHHKTLDGGSNNSLVLCSDMCGEVTATGPGISSWKTGDRVMGTFCQAHLTGQIREHHMASGLGLPQDGVLQDYRVFPETGLIGTPDYLTDEEAACLPVAGVTAWMAINGMRPLGQAGGEGEVVLVQGTGGVSISGMQIAKASGATTIVTSSSDEKLARAKDLGADHLINYQASPDWDEQVMRLTAGRGADIIFEVGGARTLRKSFDCVTFGGVINSIGYVSGKQDDPAGDLTNLNVLALRRTVTLRGIINGPRDRFEEMCGFYARHQIRPVVDRVFVFDQAVEALKFLYDGSHFGKVVVRVAE
ncbi:NAD(P)-binding protein [Cryphonectria parasitica EP155]|uniref:NAD(P)-binding protein n=1 Tax=Cryphonectria parasitica (strain ATCC 38755 / EP155) TaxID=660469 RepID=A0A9P5CKX8_CRYP1|nr:NAD(P)-binding protein [Cryphonectria parasitica EP155]KAF3762739.1 NAD(P)-binding protein [Cryphonectria parasitica EP155]